jgi:hypothetical protein
MARRTTIEKSNAPGEIGVPVSEQENDRNDVRTGVAVSD